ncbi:MAG: putative membrane protein YfhO, partial [Gammaproteobacteria bacterium]
SNHITYKSNTQVKQYAVFSEIYYKNGWNAFIDGQEVSHNQVNFILRGLEVPAGDHVIEFKYQPVTFINGLKIQAFFSYFIVIMVLVALFFEFKPGTKKQILV